jgi:tRNA1Val (adenine37-N6)-methyltransferase
VFTFKQFTVDDSHCGMKIGTDGVLVGAWTEIGDATDIIDAGAGSGLLALMLAQRSSSHTRITAVEVDSDAAGDARANIEASPWANRVDVVETDIITYRPPIAPDLIVSNPPFFSETLKSPSAERALARHGDTFNPYTLIDWAAQVLSDNGRLVFISTATDAADVLFHAELWHLKLRRECRVRSLAGKPHSRVLREFSRIDGPCEVSEIVLREGTGFSEQYRNLTADYYLRLS